MPMAQARLRRHGHAQQLYDNLVAIMPDGQQHNMPQISALLSEAQVNLGRDDRRVQLQELLVRGWQTDDQTLAALLQDSRQRQYENLILELPEGRMTHIAAIQQCLLTAGIMSSKTRGERSWRNSSPEAGQWTTRFFASFSQQPRCESKGWYNGLRTSSRLSSHGQWCPAQH